MYVAVLLALLVAAAALAVSGVLRGRVGRVGAGAGLAALTVLFFLFLSIWGEALWFGAVGYSGRFWTEIATRSWAAFGGAVVAAVLVRLTALAAPRPVRLIATVVAAVGGGIWGNAAWETFLLYLHRVPAGTTEPILGLDAGFYLFVLPLLDRLFFLLLWSSCVAVVAGLVGAVRFSGERVSLRSDAAAKVGSLPAASALAGITAAGGTTLGIFHLLYSSWGVVAGPGWTDVHVRLPSYVLMTVVALLVGFSPLVPALRRRAVAFAGKRMRAGSSLVATVAPWLLGGAVGLLTLGVAPALVQWLIVEPNEITYEKPYIANNIELTRKAFGLDRLEERQFPAAESLTRATVDANASLLKEVRLWDWRALEDVYKQFQEIRLYYEFADVDIDRYHFGGAYRQVMISAREMQVDNLPAQSQTFVNRRFKYTHGYGITLATVSDFTDQGLPNLLIRDIPPVSAYPELKVDRPQIYYGELTSQPVVVNTSEEEFDYPSGEENVSIRYPGRGGVTIDNLWRKFVFGWKFDGTRLFLSSYPRARSRIMFHREIRGRIARIAPFLRFDEDPYIVLADGRLYWIIDAYTTSTDYPYSEPYSSDERITFKEGDRDRALVTRTAGDLDGANYVRNSVKAVVDAFDGTVDFYVYDPTDPLIRAWQGVFPKLFKTREAMPEALRGHVRYPADLLLAQGLTYEKYHMTDPEVFYNQEDLWVRATEKYYSAVQPVEPYYVMWHPAGVEQVQFALILPFTPKHRQVLIGWIAGMCDPPHYGDFLAYQFPKDKRVLGPQQVETKIDQDPYLSGQLTLWDQRGSRVIRGNVLAIPISDTLLYVEPIYLQAETAAYPELRLVVTMHGDDMSYGESFDQALGALLSGKAATMPAAAAGTAGSRPAGSLAQQANDAFKKYLELQGQGRFEEAAKQLSLLQNLLQRMVAPAQPSD